MSQVNVAMLLETKQMIFFSYRFQAIASNICVVRKNASYSEIYILTYSIHANTDNATN